MERTMSRTHIPSWPLVVAALLVPAALQAQAGPESEAPGGSPGLLRLWTVSAFSGPTVSEENDHGTIDHQGALRLARAGDERPESSDQLLYPIDRLEATGMGQEPGLYPFAR